MMNGSDIIIDLQSNSSAIAQAGSINSIPVKLKKWYSHTSYKNIILSVLSVIIVGCSFTGLFLDILKPCEVIGICTSILLLFTPSPISR